MKITLNRQNGFNQDKQNWWKMPHMEGRITIHRDLKWVPCASLAKFSSQDSDTSLKA